MSEKSTIRISAVASFIRSHLLHISYFVFLSPYILKILSLISPVAVLAVVCLFSASSSLILRLIKTNETNNTGHSNVCNTPDSEACKITYETHQDPLTKTTQEKSFSDVDLSKNLVGSNSADQVEIESTVQEIVKDCCSFTPSHPLPESTQQSDEIEVVFYSAATDFSQVCTNTKPTQNPDQSESDMNQAASLEIEKVGSKKPEPLIPTTTASITESEVEIDNVPIKRETFKSGSSDLSVYGSMRVEREWTRTLACKLFEECRNNSGDDGMDMLWEAYEETESEETTEVTESTNSTPGRSTVLSRKSSRAKLMTMMMERKKSDVASGNSEGEDDDVASGRRLCCLQALKTSSGKVNLGIGRKNMARVSKALRGLGWFHKANISSNPKQKQLK